MTKIDKKYILKGVFIINYPNGTGLFISKNN